MPSARCSRPRRARTGTSRAGRSRAAGACSPRRDPRADHRRDRGRAQPGELDRAAAAAAGGAVVKLRARARARARRVRRRRRRRRAGDRRADERARVRVPGRHAHADRRRTPATIRARRRSRPRRSRRASRSSWPACRSPTTSCIHMTGQVGNAESYGRTCPFSVTADGAPAQPHLYFASSGSLGYLPFTPEPREGGEAIAYHDGTGHARRRPRAGRSGEPARRHRAVRPARRQLRRARDVTARIGGAATLYGLGGRRAARRRRRHRTRRRGRADRGAGRRSRRGRQPGGSPRHADHERDGARPPRDHRDDADGRLDPRRGRPAGGPIRRRRGHGSVRDQQRLRRRRDLAGDRPPRGPALVPHRDAARRPDRSRPC